MEVLDIVAIGREFMVTSLILVAPIVGISLLVGLLVSIAQTVTSIQEQTLSFAPRIVAAVLLLMAMMNWYLQTLQVYTQDLLIQMVDLANK